MGLGTPALGITVTEVINGQTIEETPAQMATRYGSGNIKTSTKHFVIHHKGHMVVFEPGIPKVCDTALIAALTAAGASVV